MNFKNLLLCMGFIAGTFAAAQEPVKYENLKVLPKDTDKKTMSRVMKSFTSALGVRCIFCHVGEKGAPLSTYDFASDKNKHKRIARKMMRMVEDMNQNYLTDLGRPGHDETTDCRMCHRGVKEPKTLAQKLTKSMNRNGLDDALATYAKLREKYYGSDAYDFSEWSLLDYAEILSEQKKLDEALAFAQLNAKHFPKSEWSQFYMGEIYAMKADNAKAVEHFNKVLTINPENKDAKKRLTELKK